MRLAILVQFEGAHVACKHALARVSTLAAEMPVGVQGLLRHRGGLADSRYSTMRPLTTNQRRRLRDDADLQSKVKLSLVQVGR